MKARHSEEAATRRGVDKRYRGGTSVARGCYYGPMFNFGKPKTAGDWIVHILGAIVAIFLVWWMLRMYVL